MVSAARRSGGETKAARLVELDSGYVDIVVEGWPRFTGRAATLDGGSRSFNELAAERRGS